jgi:DNA-binding NarL/FixJ family response regulator
MAKQTRLAIVDDHPIVRRGIVETFGEAEDFEVVAEGASAEEAVAIAKDARPDLMLLDVSMPGGGIEAIIQIHQVRPLLRLMMLSVREDLATVRAALKAGASGYVSKGIGARDLIVSARKVAAGEHYVDSELAAKLLSMDLGTGDASVSSQTKLRTSLSMREEQIFQLLGDGLTNAEIADKLQLSENTVKHYITPLLHKLGLRNRTQAALLARSGQRSE